MGTDVNIMFGGEAGQGVQAAGHILAKSLARGGLHVFADQDYESRVRGGHNFFRVRASDVQVAAIAESVDVLVALNAETIGLHQQALAADGVVVFDPETVKNVVPSDSHFAIPLEQLAIRSAGSKVSANAVAVGVVVGLLGYDIEAVNGVIKGYFGTDDAGQANAAAAASGYQYTRDNPRKGFSRRISPIGSGKRMLLTGNDAIALGALAAGCRFMAAYPMTPATTIMEYIAGKHKEMDTVVVQPEDEISAINMVIGAAFAGARAMTATSGGGFCLMVEGLGLAGMTETPIVVIEAQRAGPAIGLPTRTEQADLEFILHSSHGEFPRAVLAPATVEDAFWATAKAFNLADKHQLPVIVVTDHHLASSYATVEKFDLSTVTIDRGLMPNGLGSEAEGRYRRHEITTSGISPRALPLEGTGLVVTDSDEHDESGHMIEDAETRTAMMLKRLGKLPGLAREIAGPRVHGPPQAETALIGWGSTYGAMKEAAGMASREGLQVKLIHFNELWPFPGEATAQALDGAKRSFTVENNATGQLAHLLRAETGHRVTGKILKFDGRPFSPSDIWQQLKKEVS